MFLDSNVLLFALLDKGQMGDDATELLGMVRDGSVKAAISPLVLDEVMWALKKTIGREQTDRVIGGIMMLPFIWLDLTYGCIRHARARFRDGLDPRDAFHAAVMDENGLDVIISEDIHFDKIDGIQKKNHQEGYLRYRFTRWQPAVIFQGGPPPASKTISIVSLRIKNCLYY